MQAIAYPKVKSSRSYYDFNSILKGINIFICLLTIYLYSEEGKNEYVNAFTIFLAVIIGLQNVLILSYERRKNNPFLIVLIFLTTFFYLARITSLVSIPGSPTFDRDAITSEDLNYTLIFIFFSNASLFLGFFLSQLSYANRQHVITTPYSPKKIRNLIVVLISAILLVVAGSLGIVLGGLVDFLVLTFFHQEVIFLFSFTFIVHYYDNIPKRVHWFIILIILFFIFFVTIAGSRSGMLTSGYLLLISILVVKQRAKIHKVFLIGSIMLIPVVIILFIISSFNRNLEVKETNVGNLFALIKEDNAFEKEKVGFFLVKIYERIGFLDYSTSLIKNREKFSVVINPIYYIKSVIDNVLTPGFDVFDATKATHTLGALAVGQPIPTRNEAAISYNSDMMGIYGEYYVMFFGYPALIVFFGLAFCIQRLYDSLRAKSLPNSMIRALMVSFFFTWTNSFGTDWVVIEIVTSVCTWFFLKRFYYNRQIKVSHRLTPSCH